MARKTTLEQATAHAERLRSELATADTEVERLEAARERYQEEVKPHVESAREAVGKAIPGLLQWKSRFTQAVEDFDTSAVGQLGRDLAEIESELFPAIERAVGAAYHAKRNELGLGDAYEDRLEAYPDCQRAAEGVLRDVGAKDPRLIPFPNRNSNTAEEFARMIIGYLKDKRVRVYNPRGGVKQFIEG